ncbi:MAG: ATP-binding protein, partial [Thermodesulfobacteriota bacterium]|nr:ATP-binding protein [Thermodesulfobacteriota bacterium]
MRQFHSYGPVNCKYHFCVQRKALVERCTSFLVGEGDEGGHYFTIWAPRQTGKTWLMRQVKKKIEEEYGGRFVLGTMSMQGVVMEDDARVEDFLRHVPRLFRETFKLEPLEPEAWEALTDIFSLTRGLFDRPVILFIDEFDSLPPKVIDRLVTLFRDMYLKQDSYLLHGLALIGVRAVLGVESERGSPFNIQRSLHVPMFTGDEVEDLFGQYMEESGQKVDPDVVSAVFDSTRGQPGLVCWFGELLTEKYNPGSDMTIDMDAWSRAYRRACNVEWNNTLLNLIKKAEAGYRSYVLKLFTQSDLSFTLRAEWCRYLYLNGIIDFESGIDEKGEETEICRFTSPFVQTCLYNALTYDLVGDHMPILALEPLDEIEDVFAGKQLDLPALLRRYKDYLIRLKAKGL